VVRLRRGPARCDHDVAGARRAARASLEELQWTVNAFTLTFAVLLPTGAALGDRFGRRRMFCVGTAVFTVGSVLAALAPTAGALLLARAVQGLGGAIYVPLALTILVAATPPARRGAAIGAWGGLGSLGAALGPVTGGALAQMVGWHAVFWMNVPLGVVLVVLAHRHLDESYGPRGQLDVYGVALSSAGLFGLVWGVIRGGAAGWAQPDVVLALMVGVVALGGFVAWERRAPAPMVPMRFFTFRAFATASVASLVFYAGAFGAVFLLAQLLQQGLGSTPLQAGLQTLPLIIAPVLLAPAGGVLCDRFGTRPVLVVAAGLEAAGLAWLAVVVEPGVAYGPLVPGLVLMGAGTALFFAPVSAASLAAVRPSEHGQASGTATAVRELAIVVGVATLGSVFAAGGGHHSATAVVNGFLAAVTAGAVLAASAVLAALALPRATSVRDDEPAQPQSAAGQWAVASGTSTR
jgi:EmrB/QacA subfamily drug resistance transporter